MELDRQGNRRRGMRALLPLGLAFVLTNPAILDPLLGAQPLPARTTEAVMFDDDRYDAGGWAGAHEPKMEFFRAVGFRGLRAEELAIWMARKIESGAYGTVCLLPSGILPASILEPDGWKAATRQWKDKKYYTNTLVRTAEGWKISRLKLTPMWQLTR